MTTATLSALLFATVLLSTYGIGGSLFNTTPTAPANKPPNDQHPQQQQQQHQQQPPPPSSTKGGWRFWQPFLGGARFIVLQALSWTLLTLSILVQLAFVVSTLALGFEVRPPHHNTHIHTDTFT